MRSPQLAGHCPEAGGFAACAASATRVSPHFTHLRGCRKYKLGPDFLFLAGSSMPWEGAGAVAVPCHPCCHLPPLPPQVVPEDAAVLPLPAVVPRSLHAVPQRPHDVRRPVRWSWLLGGLTQSHSPRLSLPALMWISHPADRMCCHCWHPEYCPHPDLSPGPACL